MGKLIDLTGQRFGHLLVLERDKTQTKNARWVCKCDCGAICSKMSQSLRNGESTCCDRYKCIYAPKKYIDLTGRKFGRLTAQYVLDEKRGNEHVWHCVCECGNELDVVGVSLRQGQTKSCGCLKRESDRRPKGNVKDELGHKYGHLTVIARAGSDATGQAKWLCECDCENHNRVIVLGHNLRRGHTTSCGCDRSSQGEKKVAGLLLENGIPFSTQCRFKELGALSFDFKVETEPFYLIEYDGETHYQANLHGWHTKETLQAQLERDAIKNEWCKGNNIPLIRIPYTHLSDLCIEDLKLETTRFLV